MSIGGGIALIVIGAVLAFAVEDAVPVVNLYIIGIICMIAGAVGLILGLALTFQRSSRRKLSTTETVERQQTAGGEATVRRTDQDIL